MTDNLFGSHGFHCEIHTATGLAANRPPDVVDVDGRQRRRRPSSSARVRRAEIGSTAMTFPHPAIRAAMIAAIPTAPSPNTAIADPGSGRRTLKTVPAPVWSPQPSGPASATGTSGGRRTALRAEATACDAIED